MRTASHLPRAAAIAILAALPACAPLEPKPEPPAASRPVTPQVTEDTLRARARAQLDAGIKSYEAGDFDGAATSLVNALEHGLLEKREQSRARKVLAFIYCIGGLEGACAKEFRKAFEIDPSFLLTPAEDGHPIWGPVYRTVRATLIAEREAARGKSSAPLGNAEQLLADGLVKYDAGDFVEAQRLLEAAFNEGLKERKDQVRALKTSAFSLCLLNRWPACRAAFIRIYDIDPDFDLTPAEAGHPSWTRTFAGAKAQAKKALAEKAGGKSP